jgi:hypothetical protein
MCTRVSNGCRKWASLALAMTLGFPVAVSAGGWQQTGLRHAEFARALGTAGVKFSPDFVKSVEGAIDEDCELKPVAADLDVWARRQVEVFRTGYCKPWVEAWEVCEHGRRPSWCSQPTKVADTLHQFVTVLSVPLLRFYSPEWVFGLRAWVGDRCTVPLFVAMNALLWGAALAGVTW